MNIKRLLSSWQGWVGGVIATLIYFIFPSVSRIIDPTSQGFAPVFGVVLLQALATAAIFYYTMIAIAWAGWQMAFKSLDRIYDDKIEELYRRLPAWFTVLMIQLSFVFMVLCWMWAIKISFMLLS